MEYYYTQKKKVDIEKKELVIDGFEFKHLTKVLRKKIGEKVTITDGERNVYYCEITKIEKDKLYCHIIDKDYNLFEPEISVSLYLSPLRNASRFEFAIEKAVELGVTSIHPVITEHTLNKNFINKLKVERLNKIIISAMGQSQRCLFPKLFTAISLDELIKDLGNSKNKIVMYESSEDNSESKLNNNANNVSLLIGPEGGFSKNEINLLIKNNWQVKSLGKRKLRAETAAVVSIFELIKNLTDKNKKEKIY